jgi:hypothetical protein
MHNNAHKITGCVHFFGDSPAENFRKIFRPKPQMHSYIQTRFYYDVEDRDDFVILHQTDPILKKNDIARGYVEREWVLKKFKHTVQYMRLTPRACLVETLSKDSSMTERNRVYVH